MARVDGLPARRAGLFARLIDGFARRKFRAMTGADRPLGALAVVAHHPRLLRGTAWMELAQEGAKAVPAALKGLASLQVATRVGCAYCMDIGSAVARRQGVRPAQVEALGDYESSPEFNPLERAVLRYADAMSDTPAAVTDDLMAPLKAEFDDRQLVELTSAIAWEHYRARLNQAVDVAPDGFSDGAACARPAPARSREREVTR